jgi:flagellar protein FlgJ
MDMSLPAAGPPAVPDRTTGDLRTRKAAGEFESQFMSQMLTHMWENVETDDYFGGGHGDEMFRSMLVSEYGKMITRSGGLGIADQVQHAMLQMQEV